MRQGRRQRWCAVCVWLGAGGVLCMAGGGVSAQSPTATTTVNPWATGGVSGVAKPGAGAAGSTAVPFWQASPHPTAVIQGGAIPPGWTPQAVPYQGQGPDGRPLTMYYAPTYVFTYPIGPPVRAAAATPSAVPINRRQAAPSAVAQPASMQGWNYKTQGATPPAYTLPPATVARYQPTPYQFPPGARALGGTPLVPPAGQIPGPPSATAFAAAPPTYQGAPSQQTPQPPPSQWGAGQQLAPPPDQWTRSVEPPPPGVTPQNNMGQAFATAAPPAIAGTAAAIAAGSQPSAAAQSSIPAQPVSVTPGQTPSNSATNSHLWRVVGVHDGDTVTCIDESNQQQKVRLAEMDAPEISQDYGKVSREALAAMVFGKTIEVVDSGKDQYGRWIGHLFVNGNDVNREMIATGNAWHYAAYSTDSSLAALQSQAQAQRLGLWAQPNPTPPWDYRKNGQKPSS